MPQTTLKTIAPERIQELRKLLAGATPVNCCKVINRKEYPINCYDLRWGIDDPSWNGPLAVCYSEADAKCFAALRNAASELLDAAEEAALAKVRTQLRSACQMEGVNPEFVLVNEVRTALRGDNEELRRALLHELRPDLLEAAEKGLRTELYEALETIAHFLHHGVSDQIYNALDAKGHHLGRFIDAALAKARGEAPAKEDAAATSSTKVKGSSRGEQA